jgi:hypothetical protein
VHYASLVVLIQGCRQSYTHCACSFLKCGIISRSYFMNSDFFQSHFINCDFDISESLISVLFKLVESIYREIMDFPRFNYVFFFYFHFYTLQLSLNFIISNFFYLPFFFLLYLHFQSYNFLNLIFHFSNAYSGSSKFIFILTLIFIFLISSFSVCVLKNGGLKNSSI